MPQDHQLHRAARPGADSAGARGCARENRRRVQVLLSSSSQSPLCITEHDLPYSSTSKLVHAFRPTLGTASCPTPPTTIHYPIPISSQQHRMFLKFYPGEEESAEHFATAMKGATVSMALLQGFFMTHRDDGPMGALQVHNGPPFRMRARRRTMDSNLTQYNPATHISITSGISSSGHAPPPRRGGTDRRSSTANDRGAATRKMKMNCTGTYF